VLTKSCLYGCFRMASCLWQRYLAFAELTPRLDSHTWCNCCVLHEPGQYQSAAESLLDVVLASVLMVYSCELDLKRDRFLLVATTLWVLLRCTLEDSAVAHISGLAAFYAPTNCVSTQLRKSPPVGLAGCVAKHLTSL